MQTTNGPLDVTEIPLSKFKLVLLLVGAALFIVAGFWFVKHPDMFQRVPLLITIVGYLAIVFFGVVALFIVSKLFDPMPGFVIDDNGIVDNSSAFSVGFIPWEDIVDVSVTEVSKQKIILIKVADPQDYISRQPNALGKQTARMNYRMYGSPVSVTTNSLKISADQLYDQIKQRRQQSHHN
jgi:hypothetical protein